MSATIEAVLSGSAGPVPGAGVILRRKYPPPVRLVHKLHYGTQTDQATANELATYDMVVVRTYNLAVVPGIRSANPNTKIIMYEMPGRGVGWVPFWAEMDVNESWFYHNPEGSTLVADRVRWNESPTDVYYLMAVGNAAYRTFIIDKLVNGYVIPNGLDGLFIDGPGYNVTIRSTNASGGANNIKQATTAQIDGWRSNFTTLLSGLRTAMPQPKIIHTNSLYNFNRVAHPNPGYGYVDDNPSPFYPFVDLVYMEGYTHNAASAATVFDFVKASWDWQQARFQEVSDANIGFVGLPAWLSGDSTRLRRYAVVSYLLRAEGRSYLDASYNSAMRDLVRSNLGNPTSTAFRTTPADPNSWVWRRNFQRGYVRINTADYAYEGLAAADAEIVVP